MTCSLSTDVAKWVNNMAYVFATIVGVATIGMFIYILMQLASKNGKLEEQKANADAVTESAKQQVELVNDINKSTKDLPTDIAGSLDILRESNNRDTKG